MAKMRFSDMTQEEYNEYINRSAEALRKVYAQFDRPRCRDCRCPKCGARMDGVDGA